MAILAGIVPTSAFCDGEVRPRRPAFWALWPAIHPCRRCSMHVAAYGRVSTPRQAQAQTIAPPLERRRAHGPAPDWQLVDEHVCRDDGSSGAQLARPGLDRWRDGIAPGAVERLLSTSPDRLARNDGHHVFLLAALERDGCQVEFLDRPMSQDPHEQLWLQRSAAGAEYERPLSAERRRRGRQMRCRASLV
jgi:site-specific DNA recombinase